MLGGVIPISSNGGPPLHPPLLEMGISVVLHPPQHIFKQRQATTELEVWWCVDATLPPLLLAAATPFFPCIHHRFDLMSYLHKFARVFSWQTPESLITMYIL
jgi:hypothetical protein